jgi:plasmid stabilization system protein ParE
VKRRKATLSDEAIEDIDRLYNFLVEKSPAAASKAILSIQSTLPLIEQMAHAGRPVSGADTEVRDWLAPFGAAAYVLRYRVDDDVIVVLRIRHSLEAGF